MNDRLRGTIVMMLGGLTALAILGAVCLAVLERPPVPGLGIIASTCIGALVALLTTARNGSPPPAPPR